MEKRLERHFFDKASGGNGISYPRGNHYYVQDRKLLSVRNVPKIFILLTMGVKNGE